MPKYHFKINRISFLKSIQAEFQNIYNVSEEMFDRIYSYKMNKRTRYFCLYKEENLLCFFSLTYVKENLIELGDVTKVSRELTRSDFAQFLKKIVKKFFDRGFLIVGFPNQLALPMELQAGFKVISYYNFSLGVRFAGIELHSIFEHNTIKWKLRLPKVKFSFVKLRKTNRRRVFCSHGNSFILQFLPSLIMNFVMSSSGTGSPYISFAGAVAPLLEFEDSDNSA